MDDLERRLQAESAPQPELDFQLEFEEPAPKPSALQPAPAAEHEPPRRSPFANSSNSSPLSASLAPAEPPPVEPPPQPKIIYYDTPAAKSHSVRVFLFCAIFGLLGALGFAGVSAVYFSIGRRVGIFLVALFSAWGARMGTDDLRGSAVRWYAAFTAAGSSIAGKALLVLILFHMYPHFTAEDWTNFADPGKSAAIYFEQSVENAFATKGSDKRTGQKRLDERFKREFRNPTSEPDYGYEDDYEDEPEVLEFSQVFPKTFDVFDFGLIIAVMVLAFKFSRSGD